MHGLSSRVGRAVLLLAGMFDWQPGFPSGARLHFRAGSGPAPEADSPLEGGARTLCLLAEPDGRIFAGGAACLPANQLTSNVFYVAHARLISEVLSDIDSPRSALSIHHAQLA